MGKNLAVSLPRIQRNSAEHLNKLENSDPVYGIYLHILSPYDAVNSSLINLLINTFHPKTTRK
jgi:hypothetical protein